MLIRFSYRIDAPGHILHDEESLVHATDREVADVVASTREKEMGMKLVFVGRRVNGKLVADVPIETLPKSWRDETERKKP